MQVPEPYYAYACQTDWENEMRDLSADLSSSRKPACLYGENCCWVELYIEPIKVISKDDHPYMVEHDGDRKVIDARHMGRRGRMMLIPRDISIYSYS